jgi:hypothetical protein
VDYDLILTLGLLAVLLSLPLFIAGWVEQRLSMTALTLLVFGCVLTGGALRFGSQSYTVDEIPDLVLRVLGQYLF